MYIYIYIRTDITFPEREGKIEREWCPPMNVYNQIDREREREREESVSGVLDVLEHACSRTLSLSVYSAM
jgi:hypothetical protein